MYEELRRRASSRLSRESLDQTLQATALVHEVWLRLANESNRHWNDKTHFLCAAATAMRRIIIENARRKNRRRRLEGGARVPLESIQVCSPLPEEELIALDEALGALAVRHPQASRLVELRFFVGLTQTRAAEQLGISRSSADRLWLLARSWLYAELRMPRKAEVENTTKADKSRSMKQIGE